MESKSKFLVLGRGTNSNGELGLGNKAVSHQHIFGEIPFFQDKEIQIKQMGVGGYHCLALSKDNLVYSWGSDAYGQLGLGPKDEQKNYLLPNVIELRLKVTQVATGCNHSLILLEDTTVFSFGLNDQGQLGLGNNANVNQPTQIPDFEGAIGISAGTKYSLILTKTQQIFSFGWNNCGQLGIGSTTNTNRPTLIDSLKSVQKIDTGGSHFLALTRGGKVYSCGNNSTGELGLDHTTNATKPTWVVKLECVSDIACGVASSFALTKQGTVFSWGSGAECQLGHGNTNNLNSPQQIPNLVNMNAIFAGNGRGFAINNKNEVYGWGKQLCTTGPIKISSDFLAVASSKIFDAIFLYRHNLPPRNYQTDFQSLLSNQVYSDIKLEAKDGKIFPAHKSILYARCGERFKPETFDKFSEGTTGILSFKEFPGTVVEAFLNYIYTDELPLDAEICVDLMYFSNLYVMNDLKSRCERIVSSFINPENAAYVYFHAIKYDAHDLEARAKPFIFSHIGQVTKSPHWKTLLGNPEYSQKLFSNLSNEAILDHDDLADLNAN